MNTTVNRSAFAGAIGMWPREAVPSHAFVVVKMTYDVSTGTPRVIDAEPMGRDPQDRQLRSTFAPGNEHALFKPATDVIVLGSARPSRPVRSCRVSVRVGERTCVIEVLGRRTASANRHGDARFSEPEPFERIAVVAGNAYGGVDLRVSAPEAESLADVILQAVDHPGIYPRNPEGRGYVVGHETIEDLELPNLERPDDRLTPERLRALDPARWWQCPRPAFLGWTFADQFPRSVAIGAEPWFSAPDDARLPEIAAGDLPAGYRTSREWADGSSLQRFFQEAPPSLQFRRLDAGTPVVIAGMRRDQQRMAFGTPPAPRIELHLDGRRLASRPRLSTLVVRPEENIVNAIWVVVGEPKGRVFIPGVHGRIPLSASVGEHIVPYRTPSPVYATLRRAQTTQETSP